MSLQPPLSTYDPLVTISDMSAIQQLGDAALLGNWFVFLNAEWLARSGMAQLLAASGLAEPLARPIVLFRGKETLTLPGVKIAPSSFPRPLLVSLTCDKALYRARRDTIRLLIAAPQHAKAELRLALQLGGNPYADYPVTLDEHGLCLWSLRDLPEGEYVAKLQGVEVGADECRFEVAEYRLAALNVELFEKHLSGDTLHYVLAVTAFNQPYSESVEVELQVRGQRVGERKKLRCDNEGHCRGVVKLAGDGVHTLNVIAGERTASVVLKGAEQQRRETLTVSELGEARLLSMLPMPQSNTCRGMYISRGASNNEPFLVRRIIGTEVEIVARTDIELVRTVVVDPTRGTSEEQYHEQVKAEQVLRLPIPQPYGVVLLGAFIAGEAWEGWCAVLHPSDIRLECEAAQEAKPGSRITITIKTGQAERAIPVQLIVKDQRLQAPSDPQVELAAAIKKNLTAWHESARTGKIERQLMHVQPPFYAMTYGAGGPMPPPMPMMATGAPPPPQTAAGRGMSPLQRFMPRVTSQMAAVRAMPMAQQEGAAMVAAVPATPVASTAQLANVRMQFPEIIHNSIVSVQGEATVEVTLGDSLTLYTVEAFALAAEALDWQRAETTIQAVQPVYAEMTVSPFVFPGDVVMGRLDVGAASGAAIAEVRHDNEVLPLFFENGNVVTPGLPIPSGSVLRFPVRPGMFTATVRDARKGGVDVSERSVTAPGQLRHIMRRTRLLNPGDEVTLQEAGVLELKPMPGLERPFQTFVEGIAMYPFGCIEQSSAKFMAMYTGYITNQHNAEVAQAYEAALVVWYTRIQSMYLPNSGFCFYPPAEGGERKPDTHYAPLAVKRLLSLPTAEHAGVHADGQQRSIAEMLTAIHAMTQDAATYYKIESPPRNVSDCHAAYQVIISDKAKPREKAKAAAFVRSRLKEHNGQTYVEVPSNQASYRLWDTSVATREETAYAAAALFATKEPADLPRAIAATNYITRQMNEENRLYSTVDSAAALSLMIELRHTGLVTNGDAGKVLLNGREYSLREALSYAGQVESVRCIDGLIAIQVTSEVIENWRTFKGQLAVQVRLEKKGQIQQRFHVGDELELVIKVPQYEPGLIAHVCLPDALARIVGGGQVKRFSLDFCEKNELRVPLAAIGSTVLPAGAEEATRQALHDWFAAAGNGKEQAGQNGQTVQHWAVLVRNMFREEQIGNPGLLEVIVEA